MNLPRINTEINVNTFIVIIGFIVTAVGWGVTWGSISNDVEDLIVFRQAVEVELRRIDGIAFRLAATEAASAKVSDSLDGLRNTLAQQSSDIRVMRIVLQRIEQRGQEAPSSSFFPPAIEN